MLVASRLIEGSNRRVLGDPPEHFGEKRLGIRPALESCLSWLTVVKPFLQFIFTPHFSSLAVAFGEYDALSNKFIV